MLGLRLRNEFMDRRLKGTAIELANNSNTGATQVKARDFLEITYPTHDLLKAIETIGPDQGRPVVAIGERGAGKSHILGALYHAVSDRKSTEAWLKSWGTTLRDPKIGSIALRRQHARHRPELAAPTVQIPLGRSVRGASTRELHRRDVEGHGGEADGRSVSPSNA